MDPSNQSIERRIERLARATDHIRAREGFEDCVMAALQRASDLEWWPQVVRVGQVSLIAATLMAAGAIFLAWESQAGTAGTPTATYTAAYTSAYETVAEETGW